MRITNCMKVQFTTSCDSSTTFPNLTMYHVTTINDVIAFWQTKTMLLFQSVHFKSLRERMVDKNLKVSTPPRHTYILQYTEHSVYFTTAKCTCTSLKYFQHVLVLYLSTLLIAAGVLVLGKFKSTCTLLKYF